MNLFFDTETTGINRREDYLVQLAWVLTDDAGSILEERDYIIRPDGYEIPWLASEIHGITTEKANKSGFDIKHILYQFSLVAEKASNLIAHNISFDYGILETSFRREDIPFPLLGKTQICTMMLSTDWCRLPKVNGRSGFKRPKLEELYYKLFGKSFNNAHDALADTKACMKSYYELVKKGVITPPEPSNNGLNTNRSIDQVGQPLQYLVCPSCRELVSASVNKCPKCGNGMARINKRHSDSIRSKPNEGAIPQHNSGVNVTRTSIGWRAEKIDRPTKAGNQSRSEVGVTDRMNQGVPSIYNTVNGRTPNAKDSSTVHDVGDQKHVDSSVISLSGSKMDEKEYSLGYASGFKSGIKKGHETGYVAMTQVMTKGMR